MKLPNFLKSADGEIRLTGHRISLYDVVHYYSEGFSPEMLWEQFPTLSLAHIHKVIAYYLENKGEVDAYVKGYDAKLELFRATIKSGPSLKELRRRLAQKRRAESSGRRAKASPSKGSA